MATPNFRPNVNNEGKLGTNTHRWAEANATQIKEAGVRVATVASPALTGTPTAPTASASTNTTQIATTAFVIAECDPLAQKASPALTGTPTAPTAGTSTDTTQIATTAYVKANLATYSATSHTHTSANISDAASAATASKIVIRDAAGGAVFATATGKAVEGASSGSSGYGLYGGSTGSNSYSVFGFNTGTSGTAGHFANGATSGVGLVADSNQAAGAVIFSARHSTDPMFNVYTGSKMRLYNTASTYYSEINFGTITANRAVVWPDAAGTVVLGDGGGITDAGAFRTALGVGTGDSPVFTKTVVTSSTSNGYNFSTGAKLVLEDGSSTTVYSLPNGGSSAETLVDGDGRGITDAAAFRTAIGAPVSTTGGFTGTVAINPASGSDVLALTGAAGNTATVSCNPGGNIAVGMPTTGGKTLALVATADGLIDAVDIADSTSVGRSLVTVASAAAARAAISASTQASTLGFGVIAGTRDNTNATVVSMGSFAVIHPGAFAVVNGANFTVPAAAAARVTYGGSVTSNFLVTAVFTVKSGASGTATISARLGLNSATISTTNVSQTFLNATHEDVMTVQNIMSLANGNTVEVYIANESGGDDPTVTDISLTLAPLD